MPSDHPFDPTEPVPGADVTEEPAPDPAPIQPVGYVAGPVPIAVAGRSARRVNVLGIALLVVAMLGGGALFMSGYSLGREQGLAPGTPASEEQAFKPFWDTYGAIKNRYALGPVDTKTLVEGAIRGMVESIGDPYSSYLTPADAQSTLQDISGEFEGVGIEIGTVDADGKPVDCNLFGPSCRLGVISPIEGSPAEQGGIKAGDVLVSVDGATLDGLSPDQARDRIRGKAGTTVTLKIEREGAAPFDVTLTRAKIQRQEVITKDLGSGSVGYVRLTGFSEAGADAFVQAVKADVDRGVRKLVIDLRGNPGGFIDAAQRVASAFIKSGPVFWRQSADGTLEATDSTGNGPATDSAIQVMLLVDHGSASAAEIVAGALKDTKRATLVGETTYGKGTVQEWIGLDEAGTIKLTTAKWLTPNKTWIHKIGIAPDVTVEVPTDTPEGEDPVLDKALELLGVTASNGVLLRAA